MAVWRSIVWIVTNDATNLTAAIGDLRRKRDALDTAIASMEKVLFEVYGVRPPPTTLAATRAALAADREGSGTRVETSGGGYLRPVDRPHGGGTRAGTRADKVRRAIVEGPTDKVWAAQDLVEAIGEEVTDANIKAIHAIVSRLSRAGVIQKVGYGEYRVPIEEDYLEGDDDRDRDDLDGDDDASPNKTDPEVPPSHDGDTG